MLWAFGKISPVFCYMYCDSDSTLATADNMVQNDNNNRNKREREREKEKRRNAFDVNVVFIVNRKPHLYFRSRIRYMHAAHANGHIFICDVLHILLIHSLTHTNTH